MTIQASHFTPEVLLSAPRRSAGIPNIAGDKVLYSVSTYSFEQRSQSYQIRVLNVSDGASHLISEDHSVSDPVWLSQDEILCLKKGPRGQTGLLSRNVAKEAGTCQMIRTVDGSISSPKIKQLSPDRALLCCAALTRPDGELYSPAEQEDPRSSARVYTTLFARHWDAWRSETENSLWFGTLVKEKGRWNLQDSKLTNMLAGTPLRSPVPPFGGTGDFDLSSTGIVFVAKDPELNPARHTKTDLYYIPFPPADSQKPAMPRQVKTGGLRGYSTSPVFSPDGKAVAFARMKSDQYESDKPRLMLIPDVTDLGNVQEFYDTEDGKGGWDLRPDWITWSNDGKKLYVAAEKHGRMVLWKLPASAMHAKELPQPIYEQGSVVEAKPLGTGQALFVSSKSRVENSCYSILDPESKEIREVSSSSKHGKSFGLSQSQCSDLWFPGSAGYDVHALVMTPSHFDDKKTYPLAMLIHGGPQSAWTDDWSTRWNPAIFAEQGYVVVCPNPTGSTGYGQDHTDAITENWGGNPYQDLVKCFEYLKKEVQYVDTDRAVALGGSYGGYMINWIQGHDLGREFKALVCHDGVFSTQNQWSTDELFFPEHDFGGTPWENRAGYEKWDPSKHTDKWETPHMVIHSELDYRLPMSEGVAMFNVLQARGVPSKLVMFPDENHWVLKPENSLVWHREVLGWINKYSGVGCKGDLASQVGKLAV